MNERVYIVFGSISFVVLIAAFIIAIRAYKGKGRGKKVLLPLHIFTLGVFLSTVLVFMPYYYTGYSFGDSYAIIRPLLISIHHTFRVFILDGEFDTIRNAVSGLGKPIHELFSLYASLLYVLAPILTFGNVLSLFKNIKNEFRFIWHKRRPFYIFSELNERSIVLAESIVESKNDEKPVIVFTDVFEKDDENDYELRLRAHDLNAILLKKDITRLNVKRKRSRVEFFLIGDNESENVEQAIKLTNSNKEQTKRAIYVFSSYVFSSKQSTGYVLDSLDKGSHTISATLRKKIVEDTREVLYGNQLTSSDFCIDDSFYIRRIDCVGTLAANVLSSKGIVGPISADSKITKRISLMIIGTGESGKAFLKTALWLYQRLGYFVEISILDKEEKDVMVGRLQRDCPDLRFDEEVTTYADSNYHIRIIPRIHVDSSELDKLFFSEKDGEWIKRTQLAIVSLGDDDKNIETAVQLRKLFDCIKGVDNKSESLDDNEELPLIYSIVYNEKKASNLSNSSDGRGIKNYIGKPYHICFVGSLKEQYSYHAIERLKTTEADAIGYHIEWVNQTSRLRDVYENPTENDSEAVFSFRKQAHMFFEEECAKAAKENGGESFYTETWGDAYLFGKTDDGRPDYSEILTDHVIDLVVDYMNYEYYRNSSIAKALYKEVSAFFDQQDPVDMALHDDTSAVCMCKYCESKRISEHMRWNAYMRSIGYRFGNERADRGQIHPDLIPWNKLPYFERFKD